MDEPELQRERRVSIELKYAIIAILLAILFVALHAADAFSGRQQHRARAAWTGSPGSAASACSSSRSLANASIIIQIPYTLPLLSAALGGAGFVEHDDPRRRVRARRGDRRARRVQGGRHGRRAGTPRRPTGASSAGSPGTSISRPRLTTFAIFGIAASPLPDTTVVMPLALVRYGLRRAALPALPRQVRPQRAARAALLRVRVVVGRTTCREQASTDLALAVAVVFMLLVVYSAEKAPGRRRPSAADPTGWRGSPSRRPELGAGLTPALRAVTAGATAPRIGRSWKRSPAPSESRSSPAAPTCRVDTIRFYQKRQLLPPPRREGRVGLVRHRPRGPARPHQGAPARRASRSR